VQREIERHGIPTVGISIVREYSEKVRPPRTVYLRWPFGHPLGEPFNIQQQRVIAAEALRNLCLQSLPGEIVDLPYRWRRARYEELDVRQILASCSP
jgi:hypothetical protein